MNKSDDGGHAFPTLFIEPEHGSGYRGMSLRDYFAAAALTGLIEKDALYAQSALLRDGEMDQDGVGKLHRPREAVYGEPDSYAEIAAGAYALADAMMTERQKPDDR